MAYSDFTLAELKQRSSLGINETEDLFAHVEEVDLPPGLAENLRRYLPLALNLNLNTEKARSELVMAPMLVEFKLLHRERISLFSGIEFTVDEPSGLKGRCDFILTRSPEQLALTAPVCVLVEAKDEDIVAGIPQCLAEMVAARKFNQDQGLPDVAISGIVTTGMSWRFLKLEGTKGSVDVVEYPFQSPRKIFGILTHITLGDAA
jgi:hypothetical protein